MRPVFEMMILVAWLGLLLAAGYVVAPLLFAHLPRMTAGNLAGELFHIVSYVGMVAALLLMFLGWTHGKSSFLKSARGILLWFALLATLIGEYVVTPVIIALKTQGENWLLSRAGGSFGMWHGISEIIYLLITLCVVAFAILWAKRPTTP